MLLLNSIKIFCQHLLLFSLLSHTDERGNGSEVYLHQEGLFNTSRQDIYIPFPFPFPFVPWRPRMCEVLFAPSVQACPRSEGRFSNGRDETPEIVSWRPLSCALGFLMLNLKRLC